MRITHRATLATGAAEQEEQAREGNQREEEVAEQRHIVALLQHTKGQGVKQTLPETKLPCKSCRDYTKNLAPCQDSRRLRM